MYCCRCLSSMFPLTPDGCAFCDGSHVRRYAPPNATHSCAYVSMTPRPENRVIGGNDRTTSGSIGQP